MKQGEKSKPFYSKVLSCPMVYILHVGDKLGGIYSRSMANSQLKMKDLQEEIDRCY
jgi:4-hydroxyphenylpyruvate dioxygenase-like putative hemolysin